MLRQRPTRYDGTDKSLWRRWWDYDPAHAWGSEPTSPYPTVHNFTYYSEFFDDPDKYAKVKPCSHTQVFFRPEVITASIRESAEFHPLGVDYRIDLDRYQPGLTPADIVNPTILPALPPSIVSGMGLKAMKEFLQQVDDSFSIINSIYELKDFEGMLKSIHKQTIRLKSKIGEDGLASLFKGIKKQKRYVSQPNGTVKRVLFDKPVIYKVEEVAHKANSALLQYQFAISPLISDIETLSQIGSAVNAAYERLKAQNGKDLKLQRRYHDFCDTATPSSFRKVYTWPSGGSMINDFYLREYANTYVATQRRVREFDLSNKQDVLLRLAIAMTGMNNPLQIVWNAVPMSFVVDFIMPFGDLLSLGSVPPLVASKDRSYDLTWSVSESWRFDCEIKSPYGFAGESLYGGELKVRRYNRHVGPYVVAWPISTFTIEERALVSSLLGEKVQVYRNRHK